MGGLGASNQYSQVQPPRTAGHEMNDNSIPLFIGEPIAEPGEADLISRLRRDLQQAGVEAVLYANFFPVSRQPRQVDLLVRTPDRVANVEIKDLNPRYPLRGGPNGLWRQVLPSGEERRLDSNFGRQALGATFSISDAMRDLARAGKASGREVDFKRFITTVICQWQQIPEGSEVQLPPFVQMIGYSDLVELLLTPGNALPWSEDDWAAFTREHELYQQEPAGSDEDLERHRSLEPLTDYIVLAQDRFSSTAGGWVDLALTAGGREVPFAELADAVAGGEHHLVDGPSGGGKTCLAEALAFNHSTRGRMVVWARCGDYRGRLSDLLNRSMAPFSAHRGLELITAAPGCGVAVTLVLDGLDRCPARLRDELLEQTSSFLLRHPAGLLVTSTPGATTGEQLRLRQNRIVTPEADTREAILIAHGAVHPERISTQFSTPYELAIAATCEGELHDGATLADLHSAVVSGFAPDEPVRSGLRILAVRMNTKLRSSLPMLEARTLLGDPVHGLTAEQIDSVLTSHLLAARRQQVAFRHDLLQGFLVAEDLVRSAGSGRDLGLLLASPVYETGRTTALQIEPDPAARWDAIWALADVGLMDAALAGVFGVQVAARASDALSDVLARALRCTALSRATFDGTEMHRSRWRMTTPWSEQDRALLRCAALALTRGEFIDEVLALVDRTDELLDRTISELVDIGAKLPISTLVSSTYTQGAATDELALPVSILAVTFELAMMTARFDDRPHAPGVAPTAAAEPSAGRGRLFFGVLASDPDSPQDQAVFPGLLAASLDAGGYHLQLEALQRAELFSGSPEPTRTAVLDAIESFDPSGPALGSVLVEVLAAFDQIEPITTLEEITTRIGAVIASPGNPDHWEWASTILASQFDPENIVGPYCEAVAGLDEADGARLRTMALRSSSPALGLLLPWLVTELEKMLPTGDEAVDTDAYLVLEAMAQQGPDLETVMPGEALRGAVAALRACYRSGRGSLPEVRPDGGLWPHVTALIADRDPDGPGVDLGPTWAALEDDPALGLEVLGCLETVASQGYEGEHTRALSAVLEAYPDPCRRIVSAALGKPLPARSRGLLPYNVGALIFQMLGQVGDRSTVDLLDVHVLDPDNGRAAVAAIRLINERLGT